MCFERNETTRHRKIFTGRENLLGRVPAQDPRKSLKVLKTISRRRNAE